MSHNVALRMTTLLDIDDFITLHRAIVKTDGIECNESDAPLSLLRVGEKKKSVSLRILSDNAE